MSIDEPFEYLTFAGTFGRTFGLFFDRFDFFMSLSAIVLVPYAVLMGTSAIFIASLLIREDEVPDFHPTHIPLISMILIIQLTGFTLVTIIGRAAIIRGVALIYIGQRPTQMSCLKAAWGKKWTLLGSNVLIYGALFAGFLLPWIFVSVAVVSPNVGTIALAVITGVVFLAAGLYGYVGVIVTNPAIVVENFTSPLQGIQRSWELATGSRCYLLCTLFSLWFLKSLVARLLHNMFATGDILDVLFSVVGIVISVIPMLLFFPLHSMSVFIHRTEGPANISVFS
jgi:hypothetical protein